MNLHDPVRQRQQLSEQRRKVDFDTYDVTVDELIRRVGRSRIEVAPVYQRQFRWDATRQSRLVESLLLGIPIPPLFMATNLSADRQVQWEVVDGLQRLLTLVNFAGTPETRTSVHLHDESLRLSGLEKLECFNGCMFVNLPEDIRTALEDRPIKVIVLNDKSDLQVRFDLFERLNTGGIKLTDQEVRECVFRGPFMDFLIELAASDDFRAVLRLPDNKWKDGTPEDYALRFFAFLENYQEFEHSVRDFLNSFLKSACNSPEIERRKEAFKKTFRALACIYPDGIKSRKGATPVNLFEAISVGAALALQERSNLVATGLGEWQKDAQLKSLTTGPTNSRARVKGRIEFCRDRFLGHH